MYLLGDRRVLENSPGFGNGSGVFLYPSADTVYGSGIGKEHDRVRSARRQSTEPTTNFNYPVPLRWRSWVGDVYEKTRGIRHGHGATGKEHGMARSGKVLVVSALGSDPGDTARGGRQREKKNRLALRRAVMKLGGGNFGTVTGES